MTNRKLQGEIDRAIKKVSEGLGEFEITYNKIFTAPTANQKEKHENDLKREIKKLQRLREQIKLWIGLNEVKNKDPLIETRKKIELEMERFKAYERETKNRTDFKRAKFNKAPPSDEAAMIINWLKTSLVELEKNHKAIETEIQILEAKDGGDTDQLEEDANTIAELDERSEKHKMHLEKLKIILSKFRNKKITREQVEAIQGAIDAFIENKGEKGEGDESEDDDGSMLYGDMDLHLADADLAELEIDKELDEDEEEEESHDTISDTMSVNSETFDDDYTDSMEGNIKNNTNTSNTGTAKHSPRTSLSISQEQQTQKGVSKAVPTPNANITVTQPKGPTTSQPHVPLPNAKATGGSKPQQASGSNASSQSGSLSNTASSQGASPSNTSALNTQGPHKAAPNQNANTNSAQTNPTNIANSGNRSASPTGPVQIFNNKQQSPPQGPGLPGNTAQPGNKQLSNGANNILTSSNPGSNNHIGGSLSSSQSPPPQLLSPNALSGQLNSVQGSLTLSPNLLSNASQSLQNQPNQSQLGASTGPQAALMQQQLQAQMKAHQQQMNANQGNSGQRLTPQQMQLQQQQIQQMEAQKIEQQKLMQLQQLEAQKLMHAQQGPLGQQPQSTSPLSLSAHMKRPASLMEEMMMQSMKCANEAIVDENPRQYKPKNPMSVPSVFPTAPSAQFEEAAMFEKVDTDTLFFIFYYQQGTYQQYLAAKELKRRAWRYHKKYLTWFQRHEEPKEITPEYEQGTYVYFDYETGWCQRKKTEFTFEYRYLEDKELV